MKTQRLDRYSEMLLRNHKPLKNRVVVPPMASSTADENGFVTDKTVSHYQNLARSGAGLVMGEYTYVDPTGKGEANQLGIHSAMHVPGLERVARAIHDQGAVAGIQLVHVGGKTERTLTGGALMGPSAVAVPMRDEALESPSPMTDSDIVLWKEAFVSSAHRAADAGFDLVELHAAHGYGLNQWLSPITNRRDDSYGGPIENRARLLFEIVEQIHEELPHLLLAARIPGHDGFANGLTLDEMKWVSQGLEARGLDIIDVSSGIGGWRRPKDRQGEGYLVPEARAIQSSVIIPVIGVGGIESGKFIDEIISNKSVSLAAVGRAILNGPESWGLKNLYAVPCLTYRLLSNSTSSSVEVFA